MKKIILFLILSSTFVFAQKELWSYKVSRINDAGNDFNFEGLIIKAPLNGTSNSFEVVHTFQSTGTLAGIANGKLLLASNGKIYGVATFTLSFNVEGVTGVLFEYDLILNKYTVLNETLIYPKLGLIEYSPGILMGFTNNGRTLFKYSIATNTTTLLATIPNLVSGFLTFFPESRCLPSKTADGNLYFTTNFGYTTSNYASVVGGIYKYNPVNNVFSQVYYFGQDQSILDPPYTPAFNSTLLQVSPGVFYGVTSEGGIHRNQPNESPSVDRGSGTIYEFTVATNTMVKKYDFNYNGVGYNSSQLIMGPNNKLYGTLFSSSYSFLANSYGSVYEYDTSTSTFTVKHAIDLNTSLDLDYYPSGCPLLASDGNLYGSSAYGLYKYNFSDEVFTPKINVALNSYSDITAPIEICRKPSYQEIVVNTYTPEVGSTFTYNINNTNATTYVWKKGTVTLPLQTSGILNLSNVTTSDTGVYTCTMTNECGTTVTANLNINVSNLGTDTIDNYKEQITLYPNPTKGSVNLKFPENRGLKGLKYKITNLLGQTIKEQEITKINYKNELTIDTAGFAKGVYQLTLTTDKGDWFGKFVKE